MSDLQPTHTPGGGKLCLLPESCFWLLFQVLLWDTRNASKPLQTISPDSSPVLRLAPSPLGGCIAVTTNQGVHCVDLLLGEGACSPIAPFPLDRPFSDVSWNGRTDVLYVCGHAGVVSVFAKEK